MLSKRNKFWKGRRVLVTGGAGFIGYQLALCLKNFGADVFVLDKKRKLPDFGLAFGMSNGGEGRLHFLRGDVRNARLVSDVLKKHKIKTIFHLAAEAIVGKVLKNPVLALDSNVRGTWTVLEATRNSGYIEEVVVASSDKAYGVQRRLPYKEDCPLQGINPYDCSKSCTDLIAQMYAKTFNLPVCIARCGNVYGGGDMNFSRLIPDAIRSLVKNKWFRIRSNGKYLRDFIYIEDIVGGYIKLAELFQKKKLIGQAFNFGHNQPKRVMEILELLEEIKGGSLKFKVLNKAKFEIPDQYLDSRKAFSVLGWSPNVTLKKGLEMSIAWYKSYFANDVISKGK